MPDKIVVFFVFTN